MPARRRHAMAILSLALLLVSAARFSFGTPPDPPAPALQPDTSVTTVILVRHAEKMTHAPGGDAGLSAQGILRAHELARVLRDTDLGAIYATQFARARLTAEPVARARRDSVRTYDADDVGALARRILSENRGQTVLVIGHSDTVGQTFDALTGQHLPEHESIDYDKLYVVSLLPGGSYRLLRLRYGTATQ